MDFQTGCKNQAAVQTMKKAQWLKLVMTWGMVGVTAIPADCEL